MLMYGKKKKRFQQVAQLNSKPAQIAQLKAVAIPRNRIRYVRGMVEVK